MPGPHTPIIAPSLMCMDLLHVKETLRTFADEGIGLLHMDVMDGSFVPNFQLGTDFIRQIRKHSNIPLDIHLMIEKPETKLDWFEIQPNELVSIHAESTTQLHRTLTRIRELRALPVLALNPATPLAVVEPVAALLHAVLIMTVNPGYAGQNLIAQTLNKIRRLRQWLNHNGHGQIRIEVDGNVSNENAALMRKAGADIFVAGSSSLFHPSHTLRQGIMSLRESINQA